MIGATVSGELQRTSSVQQLIINRPLQPGVLCFGGWFFLGTDVAQEGQQMKMDNVEL